MSYMKELAIKILNQEILRITNWKVIDYPEKKVGNVEIKIIPYTEGIYLMENVKGYKFFEVQKKINIHALKIDGRIVMVDDPLHWIGMEELAKHSSGSICVAGLGLGLIVHHLVNNKDVSSIEVFEINKNVIELISPLLPEDNRIKIINGDFFKEPFREKHYDTMIIDLWVGENGDFEICGTRQKIPMLTYYQRIKLNNPQSKIFMWGAKNPEINPACNGD